MTWLFQRTLAALAIGAVAVSPALALDANGKWTAVSNTAMSITGDITVSGGAIKFQNSASIGLKPISGSPRLFAIDPAANPELLNGNYLCGPDQGPNYVALAQVGTTLTLLAFDGPDQPTLAENPLEQDDICAMFTYAR
ncbi:MAG: hypothetical protein KDJ88_22200 [Bauldia sp.]|nr:hypothetical protein [Bauldia sp.]